MTVNEEVAKILRERVIPRVRLIDDLVVESKTYEDDCTVSHIDLEVSSIVFDIQSLCEALAESLKGGDPPKFESELGADLVGRVLKRLGEKSEVRPAAAEFLGKELAGEWDSKPPAEGAGA